VIQDRLATMTHRELLLALERARTRLAVAIAAETKSTPLDRWRYYLDTADRMRRLIGELRRKDCDGQPAPQAVVRAVETLQSLSAHDKALRLCQVLADIVAELE
jgi:hypothetical protein